MRGSSESKKSSEDEHDDCECIIEHHQHHRVRRALPAIAVIVEEEFGPNTKQQRQYPAAGSPLNDSRVPIEFVYLQFTKGYKTAMEPECLEPLNLVIKKDSCCASNPSETDLSSVHSGERDASTPRSSICNLEQPTSNNAKESGDGGGAGNRLETTNFEDDMTILRDEAAKSGCELAADSLHTLPDQKFLTALYMSSLMQMSAASTASTASGDGANNPLQQQYNAAAAAAAGAPQNFMQLLAMVEARHRMWQQLSWPVPPPSFLRSPPPSAQPPTSGGAGGPTPPPPHGYFDHHHHHHGLNEQLSNSPNSLINYPLPSSNHKQTNHDNKQALYKQRSTIEHKNSTSLPSDNTKNQDTGQQNNQGNNMKKCRARFGLDQQSQWCKPCSPVEHGAGMGIHASIIHHGVGGSAGAGGGAGGGSQQQANSATVPQQQQQQQQQQPPPPSANAASNASSPQQEPTYVNL
ncbi:hypothetical protein TKK_0007647 [Trichogramma kaykai]